MGLEAFVGPTRYMNDTIASLGDSNLFIAIESIPRESKSRCVSDGICLSERQQLQSGKDSSIAGLDFFKEFLPFRIFIKL